MSTIYLYFFFKTTLGIFQTNLNILSSTWSNSKKHSSEVIYLKYLYNGPKANVLEKLNVFSNSSRIRQLS